MGVPWLHRSIHAGRRRRVRPVADPRKVVRAGARGRCSAGILRPGRGRRYARACARIRLCRRRQILIGKQAAQSVCSASRAFRGGQVRPVQTRHSLRDSGAGLPDVGGSDPREEPSGSGTVAAHHLGSSGDEWAVDRQPYPRGGVHHREAATSFRPATARCAEPFPDGFPVFLDDLQWLDAATLDLIERLVTHPEVRHLMIVGAYRDNEVTPSHPLVRTLEAIRRAGVRVREIVLAPLGLDDVSKLVGDALHCEPERARPFAQLVQEKTGGNPFFAIQFFTAMAEEGLLAFDSVTGAWQWDMNRIRAKSHTDNVVDLMAGKLRRLSTQTQEAVKQL